MSRMSVGLAHAVLTNEGLPAAAAATVRGCILAFVLLAVRGVAYVRSAVSVRSVARLEVLCFSAKTAGSRRLGLISSRNVLLRKVDCLSLRC